jgi:hypothetical protein
MEAGSEMALPYGINFYPLPQRVGLWPRENETPFLEREVESLFNEYFLLLRSP